MIYVNIPSCFLDTNYQPRSLASYPGLPLQLFHSHGKKRSFLFMATKKAARGGLGMRLLVPSVGHSLHATIIGTTPTSSEKKF